jgi:hypothetical protein
MLTKSLQKGVGKTMTDSMLDALLATIEAKLRVHRKIFAVFNVRNKTPGVR